MSKKITYEKALEELESIVEELQGELVKIDELEEKTKRAAYLIDWCRDKLTGAEKQIGDLFNKDV